MEKKVFTGKTVQEAILNALEELKIEEKDLSYKVLEEGKKGIFGIGAKLAKIEIVSEKEEIVEIIEEKEEVVKEVLPTSEDGEKAKVFLIGLFEYLGVQAEITVTEYEDQIILSLTSEKSGSLIGYRGEILDSLQTLASAVVNTGRETYKRVSVNCEGYREKREEILKALAIKLADKAVAKGRKVRLEPMNPAERRIIHAALSDRDDVKTESEGKDPARFIVIIPNNMKKYEKSNRGNKGGYNGRKPSASSAPRTKKTGFGGATFLGNSLKNDD